MNLLKYRIGQGHTEYLFGLL